MVELEILINKDVLAVLRLYADMHDQTLDEVINESLREKIDLWVKSFKNKDD